MTLKCAVAIIRTSRKGMPAAKHFAKLRVKPPLTCAQFPYPLSCFMDIIDSDCCPLDTQAVLSDTVNRLLPQADGSACRDIAT